MVGQHLFEIAEEKVAVLVKKPVDVVGHRSSVVDEGELLQPNDVHRQPRSDFMNFTFSLFVELPYFWVP